MKTKPLHRSYRNSSIVAFALCYVMIAALTGCAHSGTGSGANGGGGSNTTPPTPSVNMSGNWQIQATPTKGSAPFISLGGFINESGGTSGTSNFTTAALQSQASTCYVGTSTIPFQGGVQEDQVGLQSFSVNGQIVTITATKDATATHLTGTYSVSGGCANGASGNLSGDRYAPVSGTYAGDTTTSNGMPGLSIRTSLLQLAQGSGNGTFFVSGSAAFTGSACFTTGTLANEDGGVVGNMIRLDFSTNDVNGARVVMGGTINTAADTLTLNSINVVGGTCSGQLGGATLKLAS